MDEATIRDLYSAATAEIERLDGIVVAQGKIIEGLIPALDRLQEQFEHGAEIIFQDDEWCLFEANGEGICAGKTIRDMLINLVLTIC